MTAETDTFLEHQLDEAQKFLEAHGYYVVRLAGASPAELFKREAKDLGVVFDSDKDSEEM